MKKYLYTIISISLFSSIACQTVEEIQTKTVYPRMIGDIVHDASLDTTDFQLCRAEKFAIQYLCLYQYF